MAARVSVFSGKTVNDLYLHLGTLFEEWARHNIALYDGDHWYEGEFWIGPRPRLGTKDYPEVMALIQRSFVSQNVVKEITLRVVNTLFGREPNWQILPTRDLGTKVVKDPDTEEDVVVAGDQTAEEQALTGEANAALVSWWDQKGVKAELQKALRYALLSKRGPLRFFIPETELDEDGSFPLVATLEESLERVYLKAIHPDRGGVLEDEESMHQAGIYIYSVRGQRSAEVSYAERVTDPDEVVTIFRRVWRDGGKEVVQEVELPLGGRLMVNELTLDEPLVTPQVRQQQFSLNRAHTMAGRNADLGGFLERTVLNGQMPGHFETDQTTGVKHWVNDEIQMGGSIVNSIVGIEQTDAEGNVTHTTPSIIYRDPISPATFIESVEMAHFSILYEVNQAFASLNTKVASADSRRQSRADFATSILTLKTKMDRLMNWVLEVAMLLGAWGMIGGEGRFDDLKASASTIVNTGPLTAEEINAIIGLVKAELWPQEKGMAETGVEDIDAALALIESAAKKRAARMPQMVPAENNSPANEPEDESEE